jgi:cell division protein FtsB
MIDFPSIWLEAQNSMEAAFVKQQLHNLHAEVAALRNEIARLKSGLPPGLDKEEWEIIKELRATIAREVKSDY